MKRLILVVISLIVLFLLFFWVGFSKKAQIPSEKFYYADLYKPPVNPEQMIITLRHPEQAETITLLLQAKALLDNLQIVSVFQTYNTALIGDLARSFDEYEAYIEGPFFYYYSATIAIYKGDISGGISKMRAFLGHYKQRDALFKMASSYIELLQSNITLNEFWKTNYGNEQLLPVLIVSMYCFDEQETGKILLGTSPKHPLLKFLVQLKNDKISDAARIIQSYEDVFGPMYKENIQVQLGGSEEMVQKPFFNPVTYVFLEDFYRKGLNQILTNLLHRDIGTLFNRQDSTRWDRMFYFILHLSDASYLGLPNEILKLMNKLASQARTPFQALLLKGAINCTRGKLAGEQPPSLSSELSGFSEFNKTVFNGWYVRNQSLHGFPVPEKTINKCRQRAYNEDFQEIDQLHLLRFVGEAAYGAGLWNEAKTYLNYQVTEGFNIEQNDPVLLARLATAIYLEKSQLTSSSWILSELRRVYPYATPLLENTKFLVSAKFSQTGQGGKP